MFKQALVLCLCASPALAEKLTITYNQAFGFQEAIKSLDKGDRLIKEGDQYKVYKDVPYIFPNGSIRLVLARNFTRLKAETDAFTLAKDNLIRELSPTGKITMDSPEAGEFAKRIGDMIQSKIEVDLTFFSEADLNLNENPIPPTTLSILEPLIKAK